MSAVRTLTIIVASALAALMLCGALYVAGLAHVKPWLTAEMTAVLEALMLIPAAVLLAGAFAIAVGARIGPPLTLAGSLATLIEMLTLLPAGLVTTAPLLALGLAITMVLALVTASLSLALYVRELQGQ